MTVLVWVDEAAQFVDCVPPPKRGGTWLYCLFLLNRERGPGGVINHMCMFRAKRPKTYRRHWRRCHR